MSRSVPWFQKKRNLSVLTLRHIRNLLSGIFTRARKLEVIRGPNPIQDVDIPLARPKNDTYAYSMEEVQQMLAALEGVAKVVVGLAAFAGFSKAELQGLCWEDYNGKEMIVSRDVVRGKVGEPKTQKRRGAVPIVPMLQNMLADYRAECGNPQAGFPFISENGSTPLALDNLLNRVILQCAVCGGERYAKVHKKGAKNHHEYKRRETLPSWHGWHAFRRSVATNLHQLGVADIRIQTILRHESVATTKRHYIKASTSDAQAGLEKLEVQFQALDESRRKVTASATSQSVI